GGGPSSESHRATSGPLRRARGRRRPAAAFGTRWRRRRPARGGRARGSSAALSVRGSRPKLMHRLAAALLASLAFPTHALDLEGHRGARGLAPENTLAAFHKAIAIGVTTIETDMAVTSDGVIVISHDPLLNPDIVRDADGRWLAAKGPPIHSLTLAELRRYDIGRLNPASAYAKQFPEQRPADGERFPTLADVFALGKASAKPVRFNIETKI